MNGKRITDLLDNAVIAAAEVGEWLLRRVPARDPQVRRAELSREALREVLVAQEAEEEVFEPFAEGASFSEDYLEPLDGACRGCGRYLVHTADCSGDPYSVSVASGATDTSPPEKSGDSPSHQPSGGPSTSDLLADAACLLNLLDGVTHGSWTYRDAGLVEQLRDRAALFKAYETNQAQ